MSQAILQAAETAEIYLLPGDYYFGGPNARIHTILGSCVSISVWHPLLRVGGMSHSVLPYSNKREGFDLDGYYVAEAVEMHLREIGKHNTLPGEYQVKLVGGGNMFSQSLAEKAFNIGRGNIEAARIQLRASGFIIHAEHVGGTGPRNVILDLSDGDMLVKCKKAPALLEGSR